MPDRTGLESGTFIVYSDGSLGPEGNVCLKSDVAIARAKNWDVRQLVMEYNDKLQLPPYDGEDPTKTFAVTLTQGDNGSISATGADDLKAVLEGTELTITDHPDEDYVLVALTANGEDILSTKKLSVREDTEIKATFTKKTYPVTLAYNEYGSISIVEPVDLTAVPYGTTLTVQATGQNAQCELTALTANGEDILSSKKFTVKGATEVQATFVDHTSVETTGGHTVRIYPNPAQTFVLIEGLQPASQVSLYSMNGKQLYTGQTDQQGTLRIDLTALSDGVYLLVGEGWQKRLVVKQQTINSY